MVWKKVTDVLVLGTIKWYDHNISHSTGTNITLMLVMICLYIFNDTEFISLYTVALNKLHNEQGDVNCDFLDPEALGVLCQ